MIKLIKNIKCPHCGVSNLIDLSDYVISEDVDERGMGEETEYSIECKDYKCNKCNYIYNIKGSIWEYPEGVYNYDSLSTF